MERHKQIGLFFGSFNPIHLGHTIISNYIYNEFELDEIWFIVSPHNPLKDNDKLIDERHRLEMVRLAIGAFDCFKAIDVEFYLPRPSYTIDTLKYLKKKFPYYNFFLLMGSDNMKFFDKWKNYQEILKNYKIIVYPRKDFNFTFTHQNIYYINAPLIELSSTYIRELIRNKKNIYFFVGEKVYTYIKQNNLYL